MNEAVEKPLQFSGLVGGIEEATRWVGGGGGAAQRILLEHLARYHPFASVVDFGCGGGSWMRAAQEMGAARVQGLDLVPVPDEHLAVERELIEIVDLGRPLEDRGRFDLAVSTEVAEHVEQDHADTFIANLCGLSDIVLFSAALPYQGGIHHVNENWVEYWDRKFRAHDFICYDIFREVFWNDIRIPYFYRQNCLLYVHLKWTGAMAARGLSPTPAPRSLVHPELLLQAVNRARPAAERRFEGDARLLYRVAVGGEAPPEGEAYAYGQEELWRSS